MRMTRLVVTLLLVLCCWRSLSLNLKCSGPLCYVTLDYPDYFAIKNDLMLVGLRNEIIQVTLDFKLLRSMQSSDTSSCHCNTGSEVTDCHNYYHSIIFPSGNQTITGSVTADETFIACGTNYCSPSCEYRLIYDLSIVKRYSGVGFCPEQVNIETAFVEFNTTVWVGTVLKDFQHGVLVQSQQPFNGTVLQSTAYTSTYWLKASSFVDMYEKGEYVYAFFREITLELNPNAVRSRVARICKRDAGLYLGQQRAFQTFIKSDIRCAVQGVKSADERYHNIPFYFDHLYDTTLLSSGSYSQSSTVRPMQLYGVFQNSGNGPVGSAVCVYTLDHMSNDVTGVFSGDYLRRTITSTWERADNDNPFTCENGRSVQEAENNIIMYNDVEQANPPSSPLYLKDGQKFHKIVVGQVTGLDGVMYEVMFIAAEDEGGNYFINKVSYVEGRSEEQRSVEHDVFMLDQSDHRINHMYYHEQDDGEDMVYISTPNRLYRMNPLYCGHHQTCSSCVACMDPYCVYDTMQGACVGINSANRNAALQNVTGGVADCPKTNVSTTNSTTSPSAAKNLTSPCDVNDDNDREEAWKWAAVGTTVGLCMGFVTGISFMFAWQRWFKLFREYLAKNKSKDVASSSPSGAHGSDDPRHRRSTKYTSLNNVLRIGEYRDHLHSNLSTNRDYREHLNSTAVNESFELTGIKRAESFHSLSCLVDEDDK